ncbi:N-acetylmuramoyl-L-alanine amidase family protein [Sunxiuqinia sp. sy24]|uniref:N-acetylmuramoyl-L-alanine amidase family protein n=1 Tax=Sunxiuqinia sp. sy24 TaxID=3461495 RepID=UPI0040464B40
MKHINSGFFLSLFHKLFYSLFLILFLTSISHAQDYPTTIAKNGDGIYSLLKRHGLSPSEHFKAFIELNKNKLGTNNSLYVGRSYLLPLEGEKPESVSAGGTIYPIFGKSYERVKSIDNSLQGAIYYLVSGHGGPDPGAVGRYGNHTLCEDEYAYDVTLRLGRTLIERGALVYMITRDENDGIRDDSYLKADKDETCYPKQTIPRSQIKRLRQRKDAVNKLYLKHKGSFQRMIIVHVDSRSKGENIDVFFYHDHRSKTGKRLANNLQQTFKKKYDTHQPNRGYHGTVSDRNLYVLKYSYPPAVFIELGNINHHRDQQRFIHDNNRQALANWLSEGLINDFRNNK